MREALGAPIVVHAAGRGSVPRAARRAVEERSAGADSRQVADVDLFVAVSDYYAPSCADYLGIPREAAHGAARRQLQGLRLPDAVRPHREPRELSPQWPEPKRGRSRSASSPHRAGEGAGQARRGVRLLRKERGLPPSRLEAAGYMGADQQAVSRGASKRGCARPAWATSSPIAASSIAPRRCTSSPTSTCSRCRRRTTSRRASPARGHGLRRAGRAAEARRLPGDAAGPAAACSSSPTTRTLAEASGSSGGPAAPHRARPSRRRRRARAYSVSTWPSA